MNLQLAELTLPISIRVAVPLTDDELMRLSNANKPYKIERTAEGEITIMTPVGGIGGMHDFYVASQLFNWVEHDGTGIGSGPNTGFNLRDGSCLSPDAAWQPLARWNALTPEQQAGYAPLCPEFLIEIRSRTDSCRCSKRRCNFGWKMEHSLHGCLIRLIVRQSSTVRVRSR